MFFPHSSRQVIIADIIARVLKRVMVIILASKEVILKIQHEDFKSFYPRDITHISIKGNNTWHNYLGEIENSKLRMQAKDEVIPDYETQMLNIPGAII